MKLVIQIRAIKLVIHNRYSQKGGLKRYYYLVGYKIYDGWYQ